MAYSSRMLPLLYDIYGTPENDYHSAHTIFHSTARPHTLLGYKRKKAYGLKSKPEVAVSTISTPAAAPPSAMLALRSRSEMASTMRDAQRTGDVGQWAARA
ncbi:hypothetical protein LTS18_006354 [Coniosporium uncinatum]|uniref:Uncharacterized protein n=1 Tax=Coniosporium uncinatum TaxID=93489 RepID=A0ACC3DAT8_9PEZI|nr:hypothetical protein LTS18_006354 [Coniosporium uncinatum]